jgi:hypothetical protein
VHTNGENSNACALHTIQTSSNINKDFAKALGRSRPCVALLVTVKEEYNPESENVMEELWEAVKQVNARYPGHSRVIRPFEIIIPIGMTLPVTTKANAKLKETGRLFSGDIARLYSSINDEELLSGAEDSHVPQRLYTEYICKARWYIPRKCQGLDHAL